MEQVIRFCTMPDGARLAYAVLGSGPPLVLIPGWLSHVEADWNIARLGEEYATDFTVIRYDKRGTGLSDRAIVDFSLEAKLRDLSCLVDQLGLERISMFAASEGGPLAVSYASHNSERVAALALAGTFGYGRDIVGGTVTREAIANLARANWPLAAAALADLMMPGCTTEERQLYAERATLSGDASVAAGYLESFISTDIRALLGAVRAPTLVMHSRGDQLIPLELGRELAAGIPDAIFEVLEGDRHIVRPEVRRKRDERTKAFLLSHQAADALRSRQMTADRTESAGLSRREVEVLRLLAAGKSNQQIADELVISLNTVLRHVSNIFAKTGAANRVEAAAYAHDHPLT